jgi:hypothetical protein
MKYLITERQYKLLMEEQNVLELPSLDYFGDWETLQKFLKKRGYPPYSINGNLDLKEIDIESLGNLMSVGGDLDLYRTNIKSLGNLVSVGGDLDLRETNIEFLENLMSVGGDLDLFGSDIKSLGNLMSVGGSLDLYDTNIESLGNLVSVGGFLDLRETQLSKKYSKKEIKNMINVVGDIYIWRLGNFAKVS